MSWFALCAVLLVGCSDDPARPPQDPGRSDAAETGYFNHANTFAVVDGFAIVARDPVTGDLGAATVSRAPFGGAVSLDARAGQGVAAALGHVGSAWPTSLVDALADGATPSAALDAADHSKSRNRPSIALAPNGACAHSVGSHPRAAGISGTDFGIICFDVRAFRHLELAETYYREETDGLPLAERLFLTLRFVENSGDMAEIRPPKSAAVLVVREHGGPFGQSDRLVDTRIDYHEDPIPAIEQLLAVHLEAYTGPALLALQRRLAPGSPTYVANAAWIDRLRRDKAIGER